MEDMFANDPAMKPRDKKGRFATAERAYADKAIEENKMLRHQCEKFKRAWMAAVDSSTIWQKKYIELQKRVREVGLQLCQ